MRTHSVKLNQYILLQIQHNLVKIRISNRLYVTRYFLLDFRFDAKLLCHERLERLEVTPALVGDWLVGFAVKPLQCGETRNTETFTEGFVV